MLFLISLILCVTGSLSTNHEEDILLLSMRIDGVTRKVLNLKRNVSSLYQLHEHVNVSMACEPKDLPGMFANVQINQMMLRMMRREEQLKRHQLRMSREVSELASRRSEKDTERDPRTEKLQEMVDGLRNVVQELQNAQGILTRRLAFVEGCKRKSLENPSFEVNGGWNTWGNGYRVVSDEAQDGTKSAKVSSGGVAKVLTFKKPIRKLVVIGWSKNIGSPASIPSSSDYSLYCDLQTPTKRPLYGFITPFNLQNSSWHKAIVKIDLPPRNAIVRATCHFLYRNINRGVAFFDNMSAVLPSDDVTDLSLCIQP